MTMATGLLHRDEYKAWLHTVTVWYSCTGAIIQVTVGAYTVMTAVTVTVPSRPIFLTVDSHPLYGRTPYTVWCKALLTLGPISGASMVYWHNCSAFQLQYREKRFFLSWIV
ncbi:hypothetical protein ARMSODRAFT_976213 [Armillaria solidipes]|uniref:Uncharacterized protein n=1 Tax=Armillaria solidipes TaxID=1076256 RepID=A0A2H3BG82_9AGAR|nr:hypothetical protein ARMSODRAFT_976213 [Armillaria solidipes]